ncbi:hypothetical protein BDV34DRAFT_167095 [Aspergillus parasiticus]|uniref:Uncharacterized protein n=1 Tax=Aspergillus parasiticus TaxID=5067 RepID=A0A5N6D9P7_ASPPA|nr:hypothetical protein BDV34DRAFT_167095 [Aspergillus parasiticus]
MIIALILLTGNGVTVTVTLDILHTDYRYWFLSRVRRCLASRTFTLLCGLVVSFHFYLER